VLQSDEVVDPALLSAGSPATVIPSLCTQNNDDSLDFVFDVNSEALSRPFAFQDHNVASQPSWAYFDIYDHVWDDIFSGSGGVDGVGSMNGVPFSF